jgi:y4mF family transcriptional regulator
MQDEGWDGDLGRFVRDMRRAHGLSQRALAEEAGVGRRFVVDLEGNKPTLQLDAVNAVLAVFGLRLGPVPAPSKSDAAERLAQSLQELTAQIERLATER